MRKVLLVLILMTLVGSTRLAAAATQSVVADDLAVGQSTIQVCDDDGVLTESIVALGAPPTVEIVVISDIHHRCLGQTMRLELRDHADGVLWSTEFVVYSDLMPVPIVDTGGAPMPVTADALAHVSITISGAISL